jgi:hypothetical protein
MSLGKDKALDATVNVYFTNRGRIQTIIFFVCHLGIFLLHIAQPENTISIQAEPN